jgi:hypothetical protein
MKITCVTSIAILLLAFASCKNNGNKEGHDGHDMENMNKDTMQLVTVTKDKEVKVVAVIYSNLDVKAATAVKEIVDHYLHIKNALANDNATEAVSGAKAMKDALVKVDKSILTVEQKVAYDKIAESLIATSALISKSSNDIKQQREQFVPMSESVYELVRHFGAGRPLYNDYCPMARNDQGAMWISEVKEIKNPYFGDQMLNCGTVEEVIK